MIGSKSSGEVCYIFTTLVGVLRLGNSFVTAICACHKTVGKRTTHDYGECQIFKIFFFFCFFFFFFFVFLFIYFYFM